MVNGTFSSYSFHTLKATFDCNAVFYLMSTLGRDQTDLHSDQQLHFYEFHQNEKQKDIPTFQITTKNLTALNFIMEYAVGLLKGLNYTTVVIINS